MIVIGYELIFEIEIYLFVNVYFIENGMFWLYMNEFWVVNEFFLILVIID